MSRLQRVGGVSRCGFFVALMPIVFSLTPDGDKPAFRRLRPTVWGKYVNVTSSRHAQHISGCKLRTRPPHFTDHPPLHSNAVPLLNDRIVDNVKSHLPLTNRRGVTPKIISQPELVDRRLSKLGSKDSGLFPSDCFSPTTYLVAELRSFFFVPPPRVYGSTTVFACVRHIFEFAVRCIRR